MEPEFNPEDITIASHYRTLVRVKLQIYTGNTVMGVLQPSDILHEDCDNTFGAAIVALSDEAMNIHINNLLH